MMTNLFSIFDPHSSLMLPLNWSILIIPPFLMITMFWISPPKPLMIIKIILGWLKGEIKSLLKSNSLVLGSLVLVSLMIMLAMQNLMSMFPYIFNSSSHLLLVLVMALPIWGGVMLYGWIKTTNEMFTHLLPQSTPLPLLIFMVLIEIISSLIRPLTLSIRLAANMIAGHLLLALLGGQMHLLLKMQLLSVSVAQLILISLELAVALIQAYVFTILLTLYISEINY